MPVTTQSWTVVEKVVLKGQERLNLDPSTLKTVEDVKKFLDDLLRVIKILSLKVDYVTIEAVTAVTDGVPPQVTPIVSDYPEWQEVPITFSTTITAGTSPFTQQWAMKQPGGSTYSDIEGATDLELYSDYMPSGTYICTVRNDYGVAVTPPFPWELPS